VLLALAATSQAGKGVVGHPVGFMLCTVVRVADRHRAC
jgi:hypothetical protein